MVEQQKSWEYGSTNLPGNWKCSSDGIKLKDGNKAVAQNSYDQLPEHGLLVLRHRKTGDVGFLHFHDLVQVESDPLLKTIHVNFQMQMMSQIKVHSTDIANKVTCRWTITPAISFSCGDNTAAYGVSFGPKYPPFLDVDVG